jgi:uncharacterized membrane protein (Fun14 family)
MAICTKCLKIIGTVIGVNTINMMDLQLTGVYWNETASVANRTFVAMIRFFRTRLGYTAAPETVSILTI